MVEDGNATFVHKLQIKHFKVLLGNYSLLRVETKGGLRRTLTGGNNHYHTHDEHSVLPEDKNICCLFVLSLLVIFSFLFGFSGAKRWRAI